MNGLNTRKYTLYYKFFPTKAEEEYEEGTAFQKPILVEIRDLHPPPMAENNDPWQIKKTLNQSELSSGRLVLSFNELFEYVVRYWTLEMAYAVILGQKVGVMILDVTEEENLKVYGQRNDVYLQLKTSFSQDDDNWNCFLTCVDLIKERRLRDGDGISLFWDGRGFRFKQILS